MSVSGLSTNEARLSFFRTFNALFTTTAPINIDTCVSLLGKLTARASSLRLSSKLIFRRVRNSHSSSESFLRLYETYPNAAMPPSILKRQSSRFHRILAAAIGTLHEEANCALNAASTCSQGLRLHPDETYLGRRILYTTTTTTTTTQRGWCIEAFVPNLVQSQSQNHFQEVVVYRISLPKTFPPGAPVVADRETNERCHEHLRSTGSASRGGAGGVVEASPPFLRAIRKLRIWISEGSTQACSYS